MLPCLLPCQRGLNKGKFFGSGFWEGHCLTHDCDTGHFRVATTKSKWGHLESKANFRGCHAQCYHECTADELFFAEGEVELFSLSDR